MQVSFQLTPEELKNAKRLYYSRVHSRMVRATCWTAIALGLLVAVVVLINIYRHPHESHTQGVAFVCIFTSYGFMTRRRLHEFASEPDYRDQQTIEVGTNGLTFPQLRNSVLWTRFSRFVENEEMFLLISPWPFRPNARASLQSKPVVIALPKRSFSQSDLTVFRTMAQTHLSIWANNPSEANLRPAV